MDSLKPIRDVRLTIAQRAFTQAVMQALRKDWPKLAVIMGVVYAIVLLVTIAL